MTELSRPSPAQYRLDHAKYRNFPANSGQHLTPPGHTHTIISNYPPAALTTLFFRPYLSNPNRYYLQDLHPQSNLPYEHRAVPQSNLRPHSHPIAPTLNMNPPTAAEEDPTHMDCTDESPQVIVDTMLAKASLVQIQPSALATANTQQPTQHPAMWGSTTRVPITPPPAHPTLNAYANFTHRARHLNSPAGLRPLAHPSHLAVIGEVCGTPTSDMVVLKMNNLTRPMIAFTKAVVTTTTTKTIDEATKRRGTNPLHYRHGAHPPKPPTISQRTSPPPKPLLRPQRGLTRPQRHSF
jgi:hypothetical protein